MTERPSALQKHLRHITKTQLGAQPPHDGGVEFILHVNWSEALNVMIDITVLDPYEQFFVV